MTIPVFAGSYFEESIKTVSYISTQFTVSAIFERHGGSFISVTSSDEEAFTWIIIPARTA